MKIWIYCFLLTLAPILFITCDADLLTKINDTSSDLESQDARIDSLITLIDEQQKDIDSLKAILVVTSDKAYDNIADSGEYKTGRFSETDPLGGADPYSASKSAQEIVTRSFSESYFHEKEVPDPYFGGEEGFNYVLDILNDSINGFLDHIFKNHF